MKRLLSLLLASALILSACGSNDGDKKGESKKTKKY
ncbi:putative lipoprotein [Staphylococcus aureus]|nr:putative lipoprotein [Staphylococcus aureus]CAC8672253.1 putative lipoprotein [Staphylococcus aureus]CAC8675818.1 putative lipoprotein [Staphylococcus aureus]CAC8683309.1 putative lipoprotein [Staphylococcus aureus]